jgi:VanZ family protein
MNKYFRADLRYPNWWFAIAAFTLCAVLFAALMPFDSEPPWPGRWDKTLHAMSFMLLMIVCCGPFAKKVRVPVLIMLLLCGLLIELIQIPLPGRREEWGDLLADSIGLAAGLFFLQFWLGDWCLWLEQRLGLQ